MTRDRRDFDVIVVGSGPGGAITAALLAEAGKNVLILEEGADLPQGSASPFSIDEMQTKYRNGGGTATLGANPIAYVEGKVVGGGSEVNSGLYHRVPLEILEEWRQRFKLQNAEEADLLPHYEANERDLAVALSSSGGAPASLRLHQGAQKLGWRSDEVPRWYGVAGRNSMSRTFIPRALKAGADLRANTRVVGISFARDCWTVRAQGAEGEMEFTCPHLFLAAGAIQTPAVLRRSGIRRHVGNSLQLHPTIKVVARFGEKINSATAAIAVHQVKEFAPGLCMGGSISTPPYLALGLLDHPEALASVEQEWEYFSIYYAMIKCTGTGSVRCLPGLRDPLVRFNLTTQDRRSLADGLKKLCQALWEADATHLYPGIFGAGPIRARADLDFLPETFAATQAQLMTIHLFASCPMGENPKLCAVDSFGRVHGQKNLYVADGSILCSAPGVNPQGAIMAFARRNALQFLASNP